LDAELFERPDIGAVVEFGREETVAAAVPGEKHDFAAGEPSGEQVVGGRAEGGFDLDPFLVREALDAVQSGAADDANAMFRHGGGYSTGGGAGKIENPKFNRPVNHAGSCAQPHLEWQRILQYATRRPRRPSDWYER